MNWAKRKIIANRSATNEVRRDEMIQLKKEREEYGSLSPEKKKLLDKRIRQVEKFDKSEQLREQEANKPVTKNDNRKQEFNINSKNNKEIGNGNKVEIASRTVKGAKSPKPAPAHKVKTSKSKKK